MRTKCTQCVDGPASPVDRSFAVSPTTPSAVPSLRIKVEGVGRALWAEGYTGTPCPPCRVLTATGHRGDVHDININFKHGNIYEKYTFLARGEKGEVQT